MEILGYQITEKIYDSPNSIIYRAVESQNNKSVIVKILNDTDPSEEKVAQFKYEYELSKETSTSSKSWTENQFIDTSSIVEIAQVLASEMQYDNLIRKMMHILMKNAGSQRGLFIIQQEDALIVEATAYVDDENGTVVNGPGSSEAIDAFSEAIVYYVLRTQDGVVVNDATGYLLFSKDAYVEKCKAKSIICIPVITKNKVMGILYFENNLTTEAFTQGRIELLKIVASQVAICLENIHMYTHFEEKVKERTREIEIQKSFFKQLFATSPDAIVLLDNNFCVTDINTTFQDVFQYTFDEVKGKYIDNLIIPPKYIGESASLQVMTSQEKVRFESVRQCKDQSLVDVHITAYPIMAEEIQIGSCVIYSDISIRKQAERQLRYLSLHDALTGLYNRTWFEEEMLRLGKMRDVSVGIIVCDVDSLKLVNDTLGHEIGDRLIKAAADVIKETFRGSDIAARIGGDEFAILMPNAQLSTLHDCCTRFQRTISGHNLLAVEYHLSISVGCAIKEKNKMSMKNAFKEADSNMYNDKLAKSDDAQGGIVKKIIEMLQKKDFFYHDHVEGLQRLISQFAIQLGLSEQEMEQLYVLAQFHDIGKVVLSEQLLYKPEKLTKEECAEVQKHSEMGYRIAKSIPNVEHIADWIMKHHEWWDGSGYPFGIKGDSIPFACRVFAIIEAYEVMTSGRPYRAAMTSEEALAELEVYSGSQFDPQIVHNFVEVFLEVQNDY